MKIASWNVNGLRAITKKGFRDSVIALDPDIPPQNQRIALQLSGAPGTCWQWRVDGRKVGSAAGEVLWRPAPGRHRLSLLDAGGQELEAVSFEVRALKGKSRK